METTLGIVLALLLLVGVTLLLMHNVEPKGNSKREPGASAMGTTPSTTTDASASGDAATDAIAPAGDGGAQRLATLDQAIAALEPDKILGSKPKQPWATFMVRLDQRLRYATVDDQGQRQLGQPCGADKPLTPPGSAPEKLADLYAERLMIDPAVPPIVSSALPGPGARDGGNSGIGSKTLSLRALHSPSDHQRALVRGRSPTGWCPPLAGQRGLRYLYPHLVVARDAVNGLLRLVPGDTEALLWRRYLEATPPNASVTLHKLSLRLKSSRHQLLKKDDNIIHFVSLEVKNTDPTQPVKLDASRFQLHGVTAKPIVVGLWKPDMRTPLAPGASVILELTFAAPMGSSADTIVLSAPRPGAGSVWLQVSSTVMPSPGK